MRTTLVAFGCLLFSCPFSAYAKISTVVDQLVKPYIQSETVVGMTVGILQSDETLVRGYGRLSSKDSQKPAGETIYEIGSISKVFTGLLLADAVVQGRVTLNTPVAELLPPGVTINRRGDQPIALWHLSTHTSGLPRLPDNLSPSNPNNPYADYSGRELAAFLKSYKPRKRPCERIIYSNFGAGLLGEVLARESKTEYEPLLQNQIAKPLGMSDTTITLNKDQQTRLAPPHLEGGGAGHNWDFDKLAGAGAIRSTTDDLLKLASAYLRSPGGELGEALGLSWCIHQKPIDADDFALCLGWHVARDGQTRWHNGQTGGYHSAIFVNRQLDAAVVVLANTATGEIDTFAQQLMQMLAGASVTPRNFEEVKKVAPEVMRRYTGKYRLAPGADFTVTVDGDRLMVGLTGQPTFQVYPESDTVWRYRVVEAQLTFHVNSRGICDVVELFQNGVRQQAKRIE